MLIRNDLIERTQRVNIDSTLRSERRSRNDLVGKLFIAGHLDHLMCIDLIDDRAQVRLCVVD